jgi:hypothetical protein
LTVNPFLTHCVDEDVYTHAYAPDVVLIWNSPDDEKYVAYVICPLTLVPDVVAAGVDVDVIGVLLSVTLLALNDVLVAQLPVNFT